MSQKKEGRKGANHIYYSRARETKKSSSCCLAAARDTNMTLMIFLGGIICMYSRKAAALIKSV